MALPLRYGWAGSSEFPTVVSFDSLDSVFHDYQSAFSSKVYGVENDEHDLLMDAFGITPELKREHRQYWGRELGLCWQRLVTQACQAHPCFQPALKRGSDEPCDLVLGRFAIDTKYRIGSGDSGTLKKFKAYAHLLKEEGFTPVLLILREDNLPAAIQACKDWEVLTGGDSLAFLKTHAGVDLGAYLQQCRGRFAIDRTAT